MKVSAIIIAAIILLGTGVQAPARAASKWYQYYEKGLEYHKNGQWQRALYEFKASASLEFEEHEKKRTYGMHFVKYFPHRYMADCYYNLGDSQNASQELELSLAFQPSKEGNDLKAKIGAGPALVTQTPPIVAPSFDDKKHQEEMEKLQKEKDALAKMKEDERAQQEKKIAQLEEKLRKEQENRKDKYYSTYDKVPTGALTYDPNKVTQVGSRLSVAVMKFSHSGEARDASDDVLNELVTSLYSLGGRFNIIEREKMEKIVEEQMRSQSGLIDEKTAIKAGKVAGVDAVLVGNISTSADGSVKIWGRLINTETGKLITAQDAYTPSASLDDISRACLDLSVKIYNDLPLVEGYVINIEPNETILLDLGRDKHMKPDMQCVVYREGEKIKHPITGEIAYVKKIYLGEAVLTQIQETSSEATVIIKGEGEKIGVGDKVVIK